MAFILASDGRDDDVAEAFRRYRQYLHANAGLFPPNAYALATSDWYFDFNDHRCPHDSWLKAAELSEIGSGERGEVRHPSLVVTLLGAYHDGLIELRYPKVFSYSFIVAEGRDGHGDWRYDELRVSETGSLVHEIEWDNAGKTGRWRIEASDVAFRRLQRT
jgi:hypothetical protein